MARDNFKFAGCPSGTLENFWVGRTRFFFLVKQVPGNPTHWRTVRFQEKQDRAGQQAPDLRIDRRQGEQELAFAFRGLPPKWKKFIEQKPGLQEICNGSCWVFVEICCKQGSALASECHLNGWTHLGVDAAVDVAKTATIRVLQHVLRVTGRLKRCHLMVWCSTPCTAGCRIRHVGFASWKKPKND